MCVLDCLGLAGFAGVNYEDIVRKQTPLSPVPSSRGFSTPYRFASWRGCLSRRRDGDSCRVILDTRVSLHSFDSLFPLRLESLDSSFVSVFDVVQLDLVNTGLGNAARELSPVEVRATESSRE
jgi:hypothetical protein